MSQTSPRADLDRIFEPGHQLTHAPQARSRGGVVAANPPEAARIAIDVLKAGGNAMDAAVATAFAVGTLQPDQAEFSGYMACAMVWEAATRTWWCVDGNSRAPAAARADMFEILPRQDTLWINEDEYACSVRDNANVIGPLAVSTPGALACLGTLHDRWGTLPWASLLAPSQRLVSDGFAYGSLSNRIRNNQTHMERFAPTAAHFMPDGRVPEPEERCHRPGLAWTLERLARHGWQDFYHGEIATRIVNHLQATGGILTLADMAALQCRIVKPLSVQIGSARIATPPLTHGGLSVLQALLMLEALDHVPDNSVRDWHLFTEMLKRLWRDRLSLLGDPDFVDVPIARLLDPTYAATCMQPLLDDPLHIDDLLPPQPPAASPGTRHLSVADAAGNLVSLTFTQGGSFGSFVVVPDTGMVLGHGMCRLDPRPGRNNSIAAGKRPLNNTCNLILDLPGRTVAMGGTGGRRILSMITRGAWRILRQGVDLADVVIAPRMHVEMSEPMELTRSTGVPLAAALRTMGHQVLEVPTIGGDINAVEHLESQSCQQSASPVAALGVDD